VTVSQASISNSACSGDDCKIVACLTANGQTCASANLEASLTATPANYTFGTGTLMDLWQGSASPGISRVDASQATGTVNYVMATKQATVVSGYPFNVKWTAGSIINLAGASYTIASVQSELQLTLASGPNSDLTGVSYFASNFGVLLWKKTSSSDRVSIGYTTYLYGSTAMPNWNAAASNTCSPLVSPSGIAGYNCFVGQELFFVAADGSDVRDLGLVALSYNGEWGDGFSCGSSSSAYEFDPTDGSTWYCMQALNFDSTRQTLVKAHYNGAYTRFTPSSRLPDCALNQNVQPCLQFTVMQPNKSDSVSQIAPGFNPDYAVSGFPGTFSGGGPYWNFGGISPDGDAEFYVAGSQDYPGWVFLFSLGDRTPVGTDVNSVHIVAGASTYRKAPESWCTIHDSLPPNAGWVALYSNDMPIMGTLGRYNMTLTSAPLNTTVGIPGGLFSCPPNPLGANGNNCTAITVNGQPVSAFDGSRLQNVQVGDQLIIDSERMTVIVVSSSSALIVWRGQPRGLASHSGTILSMGCGTSNSGSALVGYWNYRADPYGANMSSATILSDPVETNNHTYIGGGIPSPPVTVSGGINSLNLCPSGSCYQIRDGLYDVALSSAQRAVAINPPFAGIAGVGYANQVDTHSGPCFSGWCMDAHPMNGGTTSMVGSSVQPFMQSTGQLWKVSGASSILNRKFLSTLAYVGRAPLVDVSGPTSMIGSGALDSYKYCYALAAGECQSGSVPGDVYVNAPYVSYPYCRDPGTGNPQDDTNGICVGNLGAYTGAVTQFGTAQDNVGAGVRRLGTNYSKWNQQYIYWNVSATPNGSGMASNARWLDGVRDDDLFTILPPYPAPDSLARNSFIPVLVQVSPTANLNIDNVLIEFGYGENGDPNAYYCTSRQEACVAVVSPVNTAVPFYFESTEQYAGAPCVGGCTITIPAVSQRVLYYRIKFRDVSGITLGTSAGQALVTR
jgi:hypothetical protein